MAKRKRTFSSVVTSNAISYGSLDKGKKFWFLFLGALMKITAKTKDRILMVRWFLYIGTKTHYETTFPDAIKVIGKRTRGIIIRKCTLRSESIPSFRLL